MSYVSNDSAYAKLSNFCSIAASPQVAAMVTSGTAPSSYNRPMYAPIAYSALVSRQSNGSGYFNLESAYGSCSQPTVSVDNSSPSVVESQYKAAMRM
jgi:hypothetical protein